MINQAVYFKFVDFPVYRELLISKLSSCLHVVGGSFAIGQHTTLYRAEFAITL